MRILYIDIDSLRPDHLSCYGYHRRTSPRIDAVARGALRFDNLYVSDAPCLPSRTSLFSGRLGIHTGVINHGGVASEPFIQGPQRGFSSTLSATSWMRCLRNLGYHTATVSPFGERHSAWHWYANFNEIHNTGHMGMERADEIAPVALDFLKRRGRDDRWFLHVNFWDPHTPYRTPDSHKTLFADEPTPAWLDETVRLAHWNGCGPHSAREVNGFGRDGEAAWVNRFPQQPTVIDSMAKVRAMFDGYDRGVHYADQHVGQLLDTLNEMGVLHDTAVLISADHGENLGELNIYGDHQTADHITCRVPAVLHWPGVTDGPKLAGQVMRSLHYQNDLAATVIQLAGGEVPQNWDGRGFADALREGKDHGRESLVISQGAWSCQRSVRFDDYLAIRSFHDGYHAFPEVMVFNVAQDPHEQRDLAPSRPDLVARADTLLNRWTSDMMRTASHATDPMWTVLREGGPLHTREQLPDYLKRLRETGRGGWADILARNHPREL